MRKDKEEDDKTDHLWVIHWRITIKAVLSVKEGNKTEDFSLFFKWFVKREVKRDSTDDLI